MNKFFSVLVVILLAGIVCYGDNVIAEMTPEEILKKADNARGNVEGIEWEINLESVEHGRKQFRTLRIKAKDVNSLAEFLSPAKVKGNKILMLDRNMWFVKPGLRKPVPISPRQKLMGGASNGDIASTNYAGDYKSEGVSSDSINGEPCYLFDLAAVDKNATYDRIKYWISKKRFLGLKAEFYTVSGKMFKSADFEYENSVIIDGIPQPFVSKMVIRNAVVEEDITTMEYHNLELKNIPDSTFNLNLLVR